MKIQTLEKFKFFIWQGSHGFRAEIFARSESEANKKLAKILNPDFSTKIEGVEEILVPEIRRVK